MKTRTKVPEKQRAAAPTTAQKYNLRNKTYRKDTSMSRENLQDQIGLLLWFLCGPINQRQSTAGWQLFEILLSARYEGGSL